MKIVMEGAFLLLVAIAVSSSRADQTLGEIPAVLPAAPAAPPVIYGVEPVPPSQVVLPPPPILSKGNGYVQVVRYRPLVPVNTPPPQYYVGRGLFGQPKLYVPQQPMRNFLRYLSF
jgi:hypothetical protein